MPHMNQHTRHMEVALDCARQSAARGEIPVGAVIVRHNTVIASAHNEREAQKNPLAHAEMLALQRAAKAIGDWRFDDCTLYVTLEPCPMCAGALLMARMGGIVFGAYDASYGCCGSIYLLPQDPAFHSSTVCIGGVLETECSDLLTAFFKNLR